MSATATPPDPLAAVPPPDVLRRELAALTRRRTLVQALLRASVRIACYPPPGGLSPSPVPTPTR